MSYATERMTEIGAVGERNKIIVHPFDFDTYTPMTSQIEINIFEECPLGLRINVTNLNRQLIPIEVPKIKPRSWYYTDSEYFHIVRLEKPRVTKTGGTNKYLLPTNQGTLPFFPDALISKFEQGTKIDTLILTEGYIKAFVGANYGLDIVGLSSITHYKGKDGKLFTDIERLIRATNPDRVLILHDADNRILRESDILEKKDLYKRLNSFFSAAYGLQEAILPVCKATDTAVFYGNLNPNVPIKFKKTEIGMELPATHFDFKEIEFASPKGLDDFLLSPLPAAEVVKDILTFSPLRGVYSEKVNVSSKGQKLRAYFNLINIHSFYTFYAAQIGDAEFNFNGSFYRWDAEKNEVEMIMPVEASQYMRIGTKYYRLITKRNKYGISETDLMLWEKATITEDYGKDFLKNISKYNTFVVYPDHTNYQRTIDNCYNLYYPLDWEAEEGDISTSLEFVKHIFGEEKILIEGREYRSYELGLDYIQLLYQRPAEALPVLALVSKDRETGKSTFGKWMQTIFKSNVTWMANNDWASGFNGMMAGKLLIMTEEAMLEKEQMLETIKALSTADKLLINRKGQDQVNIDFFSKFIFFSNKIKNFLRIDKDENRFWVRKIPKLKKNDPFFFERLQSEIEAFLFFLNNRTLVTEKTNRMWFDYTLTQTDALEDVKNESVSAVEKTVRAELHEMFIEFKLEEILLSAKNIRELFFENRKDLTYIRKVLDDDMRAQKFRNAAGKEVSHRYSYIKNMDAEGKPVLIYCNEKPYVFKRRDFVSADEESKYEQPNEPTTNEVQISENPSSAQLDINLAAHTSAVQPIDQIPF